MHELMEEEQSYEEAPDLPDLPDPLLAAARAVASKSAGEATKEGLFAGCAFAIAGPKQKDAKEMIQSAGGTVSASVKWTSSYLVLAKNRPSGGVPKKKQAETYGVKIVTEAWLATAIEIDSCCAVQLQV